MEVDVDLVVVLVLVEVDVDVDALVDVLAVDVLVLTEVEVDAVVLVEAVLVVLDATGNGVCVAGQDSVDDVDVLVPLLRKGMLLTPPSRIGPSIGTAIGCDR